MGLRKVEVALVCAVLVAMLCAGAAARSSCSSALTSLSPCLNFVVGNSSNPSSSCCSQLDNVVQTQAECLCEVLNGTIAALGVTINKTLALALPKACNAQTAPATECDVLNGPGESSFSLPEGLPTGSSDEQTSDGSPMKMASLPVLFLTFVASYCAPMFDIV